MELEGIDGGSSRLSAHEAAERGIAAARSGDRVAAYKAFNDALTSRSGDPELWVWLGATSPTLDEAEAAFERAYYLDPNNVEASLGIRWVRLRRKAATGDIVRAPASPHTTGAPLVESRPRFTWPWSWPAVMPRETRSWRNSLEAVVPLGLLVLIAVMGAALVSFSNAVGGAAGFTTPTPVAQVAGLQGGDATPTLTQVPTRPTPTSTRRPPTFTPTLTATPSAPPSATGTPTPIPTNTPVPTATPEPPPTATPPVVTTHVVRPGDTLGNIAFVYGVTVDSIRQTNALTSDTLFAGQVLTIPIQR
jgi:LysM repeat protein